MATIVLLDTTQNRKLADVLAQDTAVSVSHSPDPKRIIIFRDGKLTISSSQFFEAYNDYPDGPLMRKTWRGLVANRAGYLQTMDRDLIVIVDREPVKRPSVLVRMQSPAHKAEMEFAMSIAGYDSMNEFVLDAIRDYVAYWHNQRI